MRLACFLIFFPLISWPQDSFQKATTITLQKVRELRIGDPVPPIVITNVLNHKDGAFNFADHKDKLLLIDFWATWCKPCIYALPKLDSLRQLFAGQLQILLVSSVGTGDDKEKLLAFFTRWKKPGGLSFTFPLAVDDSALLQFFPHKMLPHYAWIYKGNVVAITDAEEVKASSIKKILEGEGVALSQKTDWLDFDRSKPLLVQKPGLPVSFQSVLTRNIKGLFSGAGTSVAEDNSTRRLYFYNSTLPQLYKAAYASIIDNVKILVSDSSMFFPCGESYNQWAKQHSWCYELTVPYQLGKKQMSEFMIQDLNRYFGLHTAIEKQQKNVLALVIKDSLLMNNNPFPNDKSTIALLNKTGYQVAASLSGLLSETVIDKTGLRKKVSLLLNCKDKDLQCILEQLQQQGLDLVSTSTTENILIISDKPFLK
jgi:thiol-disulfide isomerase/thioredoxin